MVTLAIECATKTVGIALLDEEYVLAEISLALARHHAEVLLPAIDHVLLLSGLTVESVDLLACTVGPGSFTGLRIGISTVKGLALAMDKPIVGVSTLEALAMNAISSPRLICPLLDARKGQIYGGVFRIGPDTLPNAVRSEMLSDIATFLQVLDREDYVFLGDGAILYAELIRKTMKSRAVLYLPSHCTIKASSVGFIGLKRYRTGSFLDALAFAPRYLRLSEAETKEKPSTSPLQ